ncbi:MAG: signal peptidase II [Candidatus Cryptobacteroides sp.]|nr:signal peptidase II [Bacteroidales bacterium]MDY5743377.1 signal peptidase II [Candidatus Cryptobacteroides sp.]
MGKGRNKGLWLILLGMLLVVIDQIIKVAVKTEMIPGVPVPVLGRWFQLVFVENAGMAFGMGSNGGVWVKLALTLFRIGLFIFLVWWIRKLAGQGTAPAGVLIGLTLISAGALGNLLDSMFYGIIWPELMVDGAPFGFLFGKVVDMFWFPLIRNAAGECIFFKPVFNFADSCVTVGAFYLLLFQYRFFASSEEKNTSNN